MSIDPETQGNGQPRGYDMLYQQLSCAVYNQEQIINARPSGTIIGHDVFEVSALGSYELIASGMIGGYCNSYSGTVVLDGSQDKSLIALLVQSFSESADHTKREFEGLIVDRTSHKGIYRAKSDSSSFLIHISLDDTRINISFGNNKTISDEFGEEYRVYPAEDAHKDEQIVFSDFLKVFMHVVNVSKMAVSNSTKIQDHCKYFPSNFCLDPLDLRTSSEKLFAQIYDVNEKPATGSLPTVPGIDEYTLRELNTILGRGNDNPESIEQDYSQTFLLTGEDTERNMEIAHAFSVSAGGGIKIFDAKKHRGHRPATTLRRLEDELEKTIASGRPELFVITDIDELFSSGNADDNGAKRFKALVEKFMKRKPDLYVAGICEESGLLPKSFNQELAFFDEIAQVLPNDTQRVDIIYASIAQKIIRESAMGVFSTFSLAEKMNFVRLALASHGLGATSIRSAITSAQFAKNRDLRQHLTSLTIGLYANIGDDPGYVTDTDLAAALERE